MLDIEFPENFRKILDFLRVLKGDILQYLDVKCVLPVNLYSEFVLAMILLPSLLGLSYAIAHIQIRRARPTLNLQETLLTQSQKAKMIDVQLNRAFIAAFALYPFLTTRIAHMLACKSYGSETYQRYDYHISCDEPEYLVFRYFSIVMIVVYPIGIPAGCLWILRQNRQEIVSGALHLKEPRRASATVIDSKHSPVTQPWWKATRGTFEFVVAEYRSELYYYEIVEFARKGLLTGVLLGAKQGTATQIVIGVFISAVFAGLNMIAMPYVDDRVNGIRIVTDFSLFLTMLSVLMLHFKDSLGCEILNEPILGSILIILNTVLVAIACNQDLLRRGISLYYSTQESGSLYKPSERLSAAGHTSVYLGKYRATSTTEAIECAVKISSKNNLYANTESQLMLRVTHPNIVKLFSRDESPKHHYLTMQRCRIDVEAAIGRES
eukprot:SAG31_NODE_1528_length_8003_cov_1.749620_7_plen_436_part_01